MRTVLFQGDSITDCGRNDGLGNGYAMMLAAQLGFESPGEYAFYNRGISGNRSVDMYARIKADVINLRPNYMSILIGVNDVWHEFSRQNGVDAEKFEKIYCLFIEEIKEALPDIQILLLEPFCLRGSATDNTDDCPEKWERFSAEVKKRAEKTKKVAQKYNLPFVPLQKQFEEVAQETGSSYWLWDGVHPTAMGHELIKRHWLKAFSDMIRQ